jgi:hypothetical protein
MMNHLEHFIDLAQRECFYKWGDLDASCQGKFQHCRVVFGQTTPVSTRHGMKGHQVGEPYLNAIHRKTDHLERCPEGEKTEGRFLARRRAGGFKYLPLRLAFFPALDKIRDGFFKLLGRQFHCIEGDIDIRGDSREFFGIDIHCYYQSPKRAGDLCTKAADSPDTNENGGVFTGKPGLDDGLVGSGFASASTESSASVTPDVESGRY